MALDGRQLIYLGCQLADFSLQLFLRLVHLLTELSKGRSHLPGNTEGTVSSAYLFSPATEGKAGWGTEEGGAGL